MPAYDGNLFTPPAPVARVTLRHSPPGATVTDVPMLMDTGADVTLAPQAALEPLALDPEAGGQYELMGFDGRTSIARAVDLDLLFLRGTFRGRFLVSQQDWGVLGRDILNHLGLVFDGPGLTWGEHPTTRGTSAP